MNNAPLTLILIASLGIVAVISLGVFFAVRPKFADSEEHLAADILEQPQPVNSAASTTLVHPSSVHASSPPAITSVSTSQTSPSNVGSQPQLISPRATSPPHSDLPHAKPRPGEQTFGQSSKQSGDREIVSTVELLDSLRVPPGFGMDQDVRANVNFASSTPPRPKAEDTKSITIRELTVSKELDMHRYGKVVGIAYRKGRIYVPSYQNGNISVYKAETLELLREFSCDGCHIYDLAVLSSGDMVLSQGKYSKLTKLSGKNGSVVNEVTVKYSTKGITVSPYDELFVLPRDHDSIYVYDSELNQLGVLPLENKPKSDCNFLSYGGDVIYVSCESAVYGVDVQGKQVHVLKPSQASYAIGIAYSESANRLFVGQRGTSVVDVYDKQGNYVESIGEKKDSLWSDMVVGGKYLYVIEYITTTIKQYRLR